MVRPRTGTERRARPVNEQHAQVAVPFAGDRSQSSGCPARVLTRGEAEPTGKVSPGSEAVDVPDAGYHRRHATAATRPRDKTTAEELVLCPDDTRTLSTVIRPGPRALQGRLLRRSSPSFEARWFGLMVSARS